MRSISKCLTALLILCTLSYSQPLKRVDAAGLTLSLGLRREIPPDMLGLTSTQLSYLGSWPNTPIHASLLKNSHFSSIRFPGEFYGNYWDLEAGWIDRSTDVTDFLPTILAYMQSQTGLEVPISKVATLHAETEASILWLANMLTDNTHITQRTRTDPVHDALDSRNAFLQSLAAAHAQGVPIQYIELGNELYQDHLSKDPLPSEIFPDVQAYAQVVSDWEQAIHSAYPDARIAVSGSDLQDLDSEREQGWNEGLADNLAGSSGGNALTLHVYSRPPWNPTPSDPAAEWGLSAEQQAAYENLLDSDQVANLLQQPYQDVANLLNRRPESDDLRPNLRELGFEIWVTEFNLWDQVGATRHTWAHGLTIANFIDAFLSEPQISRLYLNGSHHAISTPFFSFSGDPQYFLDLSLDEVDEAELNASLSPDTPTASGVVYAVIARQMQGRTAASQIVVAGSETAPSGSYPWGWLFTGGTVSNASIILTNPTADQYDILIDIPGYSIESNSYEQIYGNPHQFIAGLEISISPDYRLLRNTGTLYEHNSLILPPYSITAFRATLQPASWLPIIQR